MAAAVARGEQPTFRWQHGEEEQQSSPWQGPRQSVRAGSSLSWSSRGWPMCRLCWAPSAWAACRCRVLQEEQQRVSARGAGGDGSSREGQPAQPAGGSRREASPLCRSLPLLWHRASASSSKPEQPAPLRAERRWSSKKACGPSAASCHAGCAVGPLLVLSSSPSLEDAQAEGSAFARVSVPGVRSVWKGCRRKAMDCTGGHLKTCLLAASVR